MSKVKTRVLDFGHWTLDFIALDPIPARAFRSLLLSGYISQPLNLSQQLRQRFLQLSLLSAYLNNKKQQILALACADMINRATQSDE